MIDGFNSLDAPDFSQRKNRKLGKATVQSNYMNINRRKIARPARNNTEIASNSPMYSKSPMLSRENVQFKNARNVKMVIASVEGSKQYQRQGKLTTLPSIITKTGDSRLQSKRSPSVVQDHFNYASFEESGSNDSYSNRK